MFFSKHYQAIVRQIEFYFMALKNQMEVNHKITTKDLTNIETRLKILENKQ